MRQVFSSPRLENVEAVAKLLADEGIEVRIENGRAFRSSIRGNFSYRDSVDNGPRPSVWVIRSDDQPRARQLLRDAGLLAPSAAAPNSFLPTTGHAAKAASPKQRQRRRLGLLVLAAVAIALALNQFRNPGWDLPVRSEAAPSVAAAIDPSLQQVGTSADDTVHRIPTPPALAALLAVRAAGSGNEACVTVDGEDPGPAVIEAGTALDVTVTPASACATDGTRTRLRISNYLTDGSGTGTIEVETLPRGRAEPDHERLEVRRDDDQWQVLGTR